jgi:beta-glucosidase/6-phospho-beta-glucosidase/beta-galactosidase
MLPPGFRFGVATAGFQVEGGYNRPGGPRNNWHDWEAAGRVEPSGTALDFWHRYEDHLDRAVAAGCDGFRLSVEWARCEPADGEVDTTALDHYAAILDACRARGLQPLVTLHHFTHPHWLGDRFWTTVDAPERFAGWVRTAVAHLGDRCRHWVTVNEPNVLAVQTWLSGTFPPGKVLSVGDCVRTLDHLLAGHVLAYDVIHGADPGAVVSTNTYSLSVYELDRLLVDVLLARRHGVARADLRPWLLERRAEHEGRVEPYVRRARLREAALRLWAKAALPLEQALPRAVAAVYDSPSPCTLDVAQLDFYAPVTAGHLRLPFAATSGPRSALPARMLWDDAPDPAAFAAWTGWAADAGLPAWVAENGMCNRVRDGRSYARMDGWTRDRYLRTHLAAVVGLLDAGVPVGSYYHWTLADTYEWGSYEPRFGLYGVDRERGGRWSDRDSMGVDAAGTLRRLADGLRAGDRSVLLARR